MKEEQTSRLFKNIINLKNTNLFEATDEFLKDGEITHQDAERVRHEITSELQNRKLVEILVTKPDAVFDKILNWLTKEGHKEIVKDLAEGTYDLTEINQRDQNRNAIVISVLDEKFEVTDGAEVELSILVEEVSREIRCAKEYMDQSHTEKLIKTVLETKFPKAELTFRRDGKKRKSRCQVVRHLQKRQSLQKEESGNGIGDKAEACLAGTQNMSEVSSFTRMTVNQLIDWLQPVLKDNGITSDIASNFRDENVRGKAFENMTDEELHNLVPDLKWGDRKIIFVDRDKEIQKSRLTENTTTRLQQGTEPREQNKQDCLRSFGIASKLDDKYVYGAQIADIESRITDKITPTHKFAEVSTKDKCETTARIVSVMVKYASACMNERTNGTIHFGIKNGKVEGIKVDPKECSRAFTDGIKKYFFSEQLDLAMRCIRPPHFIPVIKSKHYHVYVVEVDIVPISTIIGDEAFFLRSFENDDEVQLYRIDIYGDAVEAKGPALQKFMKEKSELTSHRKLAENRVGQRKFTRPDLRVELQEFLCSGEEYIDTDIYPLVFVSPPDKDMNTKYFLNNFEFIKNLDARAIFDFDHKQGSETIESSLAERDEVFMTKIVDEFDDERNEIKKKEKQNTLDDIKNSKHKTWIYCNGFESGNKPALNAVEWTKQRTKAFREIVTFYKDEIPPDRARVIILLLSKEFEVLSEAVREIALLFQNQWIVLAANEDIATAWKDTMLKLHPTCVDKSTLDSKCLVGSSWQLLNETILQFTRLQKPKTTEIPTAKGPFHRIPERIKKEMCDIHILSRNECENETVDDADDGKHKRDVEVDFYRGLQVTWWNFFYQDQVLVRKHHRIFVALIQEALNGQIPYGEKIAKAVIYHQPGAGGTTSARQVLWDLRQQFPCCVVERVTDQTADQIQRLRVNAKDDHPKPPVILLDNIDDEDIEKLSDKLLQMARNDDSAVFCLLLKCSRQIQLPFEKCPIRMTLKHELANEDIRWLEDKSRKLQESFDDKSGTNPKFLIAFNIMKSNFNKDAIQSTVKEFVDAVAQHERTFLLYLSLINAYDIGYQPLPVACFDPIMRTFASGRILGKGWEQRLGQPIRVLLNRSHRPVIGGTALSFRLISPLLAKEILKYLMNIDSADLSETAFRFFNSKLFENRNAVNDILFRCAASLLKKRRWIVKKEDDGLDKPIHELLSPLLQEIFESKNESGAVKVVERGFEVIGDPMIAQQAARLHIELRNMHQAEKLILEAIKISPNNAYLYHTYGTLYRTELKTLLHRGCTEQKTVNLISSSDAVLAIGFAQKAIHKYQQAEDITKRGSHGSPSNPFGLIGILETVIYLLDILIMSECFASRDELHRFLTQSDHIVNSASALQENEPFLKNLQSFVDGVMATLETELNTLRTEKRTESKSIMSFLSTGSLEKIQTNLNNYFGENVDEPPECYSDTQKAEFRRCRAKTLRCFSLVGILKQNKSKLSSIQQSLTHMKTNIDLSKCIVKSFDYLVAISCVLKLECTPVESVSFKRNISNVPFETCQIWSKLLFENTVRANRSDIEANLFIILLNWPQSPDPKDNPVNHDMLRSAMDTLLKLSETRTERRVQMPLFYIGKGIGYNRIILPQSLRLFGDAQSRNPLRSRPAYETLRRFEGLLTSGGNVVSVKFQMSNSPGAPTIDIPLERRISNKTRWNKKVYFVVGLGMSGILAYDTTTETPEELQTQTFEISQRRLEPARKQTKHIAHQGIDSFGYPERIPLLLQQWRIVNEQLTRCQYLPQRHELHEQMRRLDADINALVRLRIAQVEASSYYL